jgi:hypothetical protein
MKAIGFDWFDQLEPTKGFEDRSGNSHVIRNTCSLSGVFRHDHPR